MRREAEARLHPAEAGLREPGLRAFLRARPQSFPEGCPVWAGHAPAPLSPWCQLLRPGLTQGGPGGLRALLQHTEPGVHARPGHGTGLVIATPSVPPRGSRAAWTGRRSPEGWLDGLFQLCVALGGVALGPQLGPQHVEVCAGAVAFSPPSAGRDQRALLKQKKERTLSGM